jgi:hypothetical protein
MRVFLIVVVAVSLSSSAFARTLHADQEEGADRALAPVLAPIALPDEPTFQPGLRANARRSAAKRPAHITGKIVMAGRAYTFGSGGAGRGSIPYGDFPVTPKDVGSWGRAHGAIGIAHNSIPDPKYQSRREGIELHAIGPRLRTEGCVGVLKDQWAIFKRELFGMLDAFGAAWLHIGPEGAAITVDREPPAPSTLVALRGDEEPAPRVRHARAHRYAAARHHSHYRHCAAHHRHYAAHHHHHRYWGHKRYAFSR